MSDQFLTIVKPSEGLYKEKGSKFIAYAYPVHDEDEVKDYLEFLKKEHHNARHYCYAFSIGHPQAYYRANDDGEPNHSAGDPILRQIQSQQLTNVLIVVVRYFGGTKLGVSGLVNAYKTAAAEALRNTISVEKYLKEIVLFSYNYDQTNEVMKLISDFEVEIISQEFQADCQMEVKIRKSKHQSFIEGLYQLNLRIITTS